MIIKRALSKPRKWVDRRDEDWGEKRGKKTSEITRGGMGEERWGESKDSDKIAYGGKKKARRRMGKTRGQEKPEERTLLHPRRCPTERRKRTAR